MTTIMILALAMLTALGGSPSTAEKNASLPLTAATIEKLAQQSFALQAPTASEASLLPADGKGITARDMGILLAGAGAGALFGLIVDEGHGAGRGALVGLAAAGVYLFATRF